MSRAAELGLRVRMMDRFMDKNGIAAVGTLCVLMMSCFSWGRSSPPATTLFSKLETIDIESKVRTIVYVAPEHFEAPNWTRDGVFFLFNQDGRIYRLPVGGGRSEEHTSAL